MPMMTAITNRKLKVFHASPARLGARAVTRLIAGTPHDLLYVNAMLNPALGLYESLGFSATHEGMKLHLT